MSTTRWQACAIAIWAAPLARWRPRWPQRQALPSAPLGWVLVGCSLIEVFMAYRLPQTHSGHDMPFDWREYRSGRYLRLNLKAAWDNQVIWLSIVGLAVFWSIEIAGLSPSI